jgi:hypothetical protein
MLNQTSSLKIKVSFQSHNRMNSDHLPEEDIVSFPRPDVFDWRL